MREGNIPTRRCTVLDIPWMLEVAQECYRKPFDRSKALAWGERAMLDPKMGFFRSSEAWGCAVLAELFYEQRPKAMMLFLASRKARPWQALAAFRAMLEWSSSQGCASFDFGEDTGMRIEVLAKYFGARMNQPTYRVELFSPQKNFWTEAA